MRSRLTDMLVLLKDFNIQLFQFTLSDQSLKPTDKTEGEYGILMNNSNK